MRALLFSIVAMVLSSNLSQAQTRGDTPVPCTSNFARIQGVSCVTSSGKRFYLALVYAFNGGRQEIWKDLTDNKYWSHNLGPQSYDYAKTNKCNHPAILAAQTKLGVTFGIPNNYVLKDVFLRNFFSEVELTPSSTGYWMSKGVVPDNSYPMHFPLTQDFVDSDTGEYEKMDISGNNRYNVYGDLRCSTHNSGGLVW